MKPLQLKMSAFGSYAGEEIIDFTKVDHGIFLITGDTGAGKTTIFDAMTFALYDQTSGGRREAADMRSQYANPEMPTFVEFTFLLRGETYTIKRNPRYQRASKRKDKDGNPKLTTESPSVELYLPGGTLFTGKMKETNEKIVDLIGIDVDQFTQIAMIAQGDFLKLLHASSNSRKEIFAKIFHTSFYAKVEEQLRNRARDMERSLAENKTLCIHELENVSPMQDSEFHESWLTLSKSWNGANGSIYIQTTEILPVLSDVVKEMQHAFDHAQKQVDCLEETVSIEKQLKEKEAMKQTSMLRVKQLEDYIAEQQEPLKLVAEEKDKATEQYHDKQESLVTEIDRLQQAMPKYLSLQDMMNQKEKAQDAYNKSNAILIEQHIDFKTGDNIEELIKQQTSLQQNCSEIVEKQSAMRSFELLVKDYFKVQNNVEVESEKTVKLLSDYEGKSKDFDEKNASFIREQAGIIAQKLEENKPCPVCGSTMHPAPASLSDKAITEEMVKQARKVRDQADKALQQQQQSLQQQQIEESRLSAQIQQEGIHLIGEHFQIEQVKEQCREIATVWITQTNKWKHCLQVINTAQLLVTLEEKVNILTEQLPKEDYLTAKGKLQEAQQLKNELQQRMQQATKAYETQASIMEQKKGSLGAENTMQKQVQEDVEKLQEKFKMHQMENQLAGILLEDGEQYEDIYRQAKEQQQSLYGKLHTNIEAQKKIVKLFSQREKLTQEYAVLSKLDKTANGNVTGCVKIDFQTFIQRKYFQKMIMEANKRLLRMSNHQFILKCRDIEATGTQGAAGLDLDVYSLITDSCRDVKTLSGGESFMAALSMALGMSDVIMHTVGKVHIDTMFVDEGFGSLDEESRAQAIAILQELAGGNRLIGIISHVTELKEQIDRKLVVKKTEKGSAISWLLDC